MVNDMDQPRDNTDLNAEASARQVIENVQTATRTMGFVEGIREATTGHEIDAGGQPLDIDLVRDLIHVVRGRGTVQREDLLLLLHPAQLYILRADEEMLRHGELAWRDGTTGFRGIPVLQDTTLPKAVVYLVDPSAITMGGQVMYPDRTGRLTGLKHPAAYGQ